MDNLTNKEFWIKFWSSKSDIYQEIKPNFIYNDIFKNLFNKKKHSSFIEIGGFPGYMAIFLSKYHRMNCTMLDYIIHQPTIINLLKINDLEQDSIKTIESNFFDYNPKTKYDLVFSNGFLEHFDDTEFVIRKHTDFLELNGTLLISIPNFKGLNGWFQKIFDKENYNKHNINCMDINLLKSICTKLELRNINVFYYGGFSIWLEKKEKSSLFGKILRTLIFYPGKFIFKLFPYESKMFSPFIIITAENKL